MSEPDIVSSLQPIELNSLRSEIAQLPDLDENSELGKDDEKLLNDVVLEIEGKFGPFFSELSTALSLLQNQDLDEFIEHGKKQLSEIEAESANVDREIEEVSRRWVEDYSKLESELENLSCLVENIESQSPANTKEKMEIDVSKLADDQADSSNSHEYKFKMLELSHELEKKETILKSMQDLDSIFKRFETIEKIEDAVNGLKVIEIKENSIRLSLKTYIPYLDIVSPQQGIESVTEPLEVNHELIVETEDKTMELKNAEVLPNNIFIDEIVDAAKSFRRLYPMFPAITARSSLEWFVRRVQDRIALSSLRQFVVKNANKSRHSYEYLDREDIILAHLVGGLDAFIRLPQSWPLSDAALELISLKSTSQYSKEVSLSFLCRIVEVANSLDLHVRRSISNFTDSIEEILMQQMRVELRPHTMNTK